MSESIWEELARSPLDPDPNERPMRFPPVIAFVAAAVAGLAIGAFALGKGGTAETTTTVAAATTTTTAAPDPSPEVPDGYIDADGVGLRPVAAFSRDGNLYVIVNESVRSDLVPADTGSFHSADWVLTGDGRDVRATRSIESALAPGMTTVEFADVTSIPGSDPALIVRRGTEMVARTGCQGCGAISVNEAAGEFLLEGIDRPYLLQEPVLIDVGGGLTVSVDTLEFTDEWGWIEWHVIDENEGRIRADIRVVFDGTDDPALDGVNPTQLIAESLFQSSQQNPAMANPQAFTRSGAQLLDRVGELISEENAATALLLRWSIEWQHPVGEEIVVPIDTIADLGIID